MINSSIDNRDQAFKIDYDVQIENKVSAFGDEIYLSVDYYQEWKGGSIDERKLDLLLPYKSKNTTRYIIDIPEGFKVSELPESINISSEFMTVDAGYQIEGNQIIYTKTMALPTAEIKKTQFEEFNKIIEDLTNFYDEQITLTKK